jgi:MFS family permease
MTSNTSNKSILKIIFLTLFIDLIGFSIIFPVFPQIAQYYLANDADNVILQGIFQIIDLWKGFGPHHSFLNSMILFGGIGGSIYSIMQFIFSPIWGRISDRIGRRPVLIMTSFGNILSYLLWFFSGSFTLFFLSRIFAGVMGGNISTATIVVSDITTKENRSRGMAVIGIAFALGFILGPAIGGMLSMGHFSTGILGMKFQHPFGIIALVGALLATYNFMLLVLFLPETHTPNPHHYAHIPLFQRWIPFLRQGLNINVRTINRTYFLYLMIFSGMEFTLTFLSFERFQYKPMQNAYMFIFSGIIIALIQGGVVRRKAASLGEAKLIKVGFISVIIGLLIIALSNTPLFLFLGLFFLSAGSALVIPCMTALVTLFSDDKNQGESVGIFRSYGSFARILGPIVATLLYWNFGSKVAYALGGIMIVAPILLFRKVVQE